jgi:hypothetical protein
MIDSKAAQRGFAWLESPNKPTWIKSHPVAVTLVGLLIGHNAEQHPWVTAHNSLAQSCGCGLTHIKDELDMLEARGWITKTGVKGEIKGFSLIEVAGDGYSKCLAPSELTVTPEAKELASWYCSIQKQHWSDVSKRNRREAGKKNLMQNRQLSAARIIQQCGSFERAKSLAA